MKGGLCPSAVNMRSMALIELPGIPSHVEPGLRSDRDRSTLWQICNTIPPQHGYVTSRHRSIEGIYTGKFLHYRCNISSGHGFRVSLQSRKNRSDDEGFNTPYLSNAFRAASITSKQVTRLPTTDLHPKRKSKNSPSQGCKRISFHSNLFGVHVTFSGRHFRPSLIFSDRNATDKGFSRKHVISKKRISPFQVPPLRWAFPGNRPWGGPF